MACCLCGCFPQLPRVATWLGSGGSTLFPFLGNWFLIRWLFALLLMLAFFGWLSAASIWGRLTIKFIIWEVIADEHGIDPTGTLDTLIYELPCDTFIFQDYDIYIYSLHDIFPLKHVWVFLARQFSAALSILPPSMLVQTAGFKLPSLGRISNL